MRYLFFILSFTLSGSEDYFLLLQNLNSKNSCDTKACEGLFRTHCTEFESQREKFEKLRPGFFYEAIRDDNLLYEICRFTNSNLDDRFDVNCNDFDKDKFLESVKRNNISSCSELNQKVAGDDDVIYRYCDMYVSRVAANNIPQENIKNTENKLDEIKKIFLRDPSLSPEAKKVLGEIELVSKFQAASFHFGVRDFSTICSSIRGDSSLDFCKNADENSGKMYLCPRGKIYLPQNQLEFVIAHELVHVIRNIDKNWGSSFTNSFSEKNKFLKDFLVEDEISENGKFEEATADIIAAKILSESGKDLNAYNSYFCDLFDAQKSKLDYYKEASKYMHPKDRLEILTCPFR